MSTVELSVRDSRRTLALAHAESTGWSRPTAVAATVRRALPKRNDGCATRTTPSMHIAQQRTEPGARCSFSTSGLIKATMIGVRKVKQLMSPSGMSCTAKNSAELDPKPVRPRNSSSSFLRRGRRGEVRDGRRVGLPQCCVAAAHLLPNGLYVPARKSWTATKAMTTLERTKMISHVGMPSRPASLTKSPIIEKQNALAA